MISYHEFLASKRLRVKPVGIDVPVAELNPHLALFQPPVVRWALKLGRACVWAGCGMGKTLMQLDWLDQILKRKGGAALLVAPLAVTSQTIAEAVKFGIASPIRFVNGAEAVLPGINVTNYEKLSRFDPDVFTALVLDESGILKSTSGATRTAILSDWTRVPFRLACSATPAPNDWTEIANHAEFMGVMRRQEVLATFFRHDGGSTADWTLMKHAESAFWEWVSGWAVMFEKPSDLGFDDGRFVLPPIHYHQHVVESAAKPGEMFVAPAETLTERRNARRESLPERARVAADLVNSTPGPWVVWCHLNDEGHALASAINGAVEVAGRHDDDAKRERMKGFVQGKFRVLVSKPSICGWGMNWQHCPNMAFVGLSDSWEEFYQAVRRCWRSGQEREVNAHLIISEREGNVLANIKRKGDDAERMLAKMVENMAVHTVGTLDGDAEADPPLEPTFRMGDKWTFHRNDCVQAIRGIPDNSIDYVVFSPPFRRMYAYSSLAEDMGNCRTDDEFDAHFRYLVPELLRVVKPGRLVSMHCMYIPALKERHGYIGLQDFRGFLVREMVNHEGGDIARAVTILLRRRAEAMEDGDLTRVEALDATIDPLYQEAIRDGHRGFIFHSEATIWKNPVTQMQRTKSIGLLHKQVTKDSTMSRQGCADFFITFRKPAVHEAPVAGLLTRFIGDPSLSPIPDASQSSAESVLSRRSIEVWQRYADPVWDDIRENHTLQKAGKDDGDELHLCPLQLDVIERGIELWSNPGETVLSPFGGIGSEGYQAIKMGRRFIGIEVKPSYFEVGCKNLMMAEAESRQRTLDFGRKVMA